MNKKLIVISFLIAAVLFVCATAGTIFYYNGILNERNSEIANLKFQISHPPILVTALGSNEIGQDYPYRASFSYNYLYVTGSVNNTGEGTAYNAGLHVVAYNETGGLLTDMTVPLLMQHSELTLKLQPTFIPIGTLIVRHNLENFTVGRLHQLN